MTVDALRQLLKELAWTLDVHERSDGTYYYAVKRHFKNIYLCSLKGLLKLSEAKVREKIESKAVRKPVRSVTK